MSTFCMLCHVHFSFGGTLYILKTLPSRTPLDTHTRLLYPYAFSYGNWHWCAWHSAVGSLCKRRAVNIHRLNDEYACSWKTFEHEVVLRSVSNATLVVCVSRRRYWIVSENGIKTCVCDSWLLHLFCLIHLCTFYKIAFYWHGKFQLYMEWLCLIITLT